MSAAAWQPSYTDSYCCKSFIFDPSNWSNNEFSTISLNPKYSCFYYCFCDRGRFFNNVPPEAQTNILFKIYVSTKVFPQILKDFCLLPGPQYFTCVNARVAK